MLDTKIGSTGRQASPSDITIMDAVDSSIRLLRRQWRVITSSVAIVLTVGVLYALLAPRQYTARVMIEADLSRQEINPPQQNMASPPSPDPNEIDSEIEVIRSANVLLPVVKQLKLEEGNSQSPRSSGPLGWLSGPPHADEQAQAATALEVLDKSLDVKRLGKTHVMELVFKARTPTQASEIANAIANSFIHDRRQTKYEAVQKAITWVENRLEEARKQSSAADEELEKFKVSRAGGDATVKSAGEQAQIEVRGLENRARGLRAAYEQYATFLHRDVEQLRQQAMPTSGSRIISLALPPLKPSSPKLSSVAGGALLAGLFLGFAIALFRDMADRSFRTRQQVKKTLGVPCIAMIPRLGAAASKPNKFVRLLPPKFKSLCDKLKIKIMSTDHVAPAVDLPPIVVEPPLSPFAEAMQTVRLTIDQEHVHSTAQVIGVTSALPGEGKSTLAATLAQTLVRAGKRVVLIDCDLRVARLTKVLASKSAVGLRDIVTNQVSAESAMKLHEAGFMFLAAGGESHTRHPIEIFTAPDAHLLFDELRKSFDYIIADLPPLNPIVDTRGVSRLVDSYLLVIEWGETKAQVVAQSLDMASTVKDRMLGVVLNKVDLEHLGDYECAYVAYENYYAATPIYSSPRPALI